MRMESPTLNCKQVPQPLTLNPQPQADIRYREAIPGPGQYTTRKDLSYEWSESFGDRAEGGLWGQEPRTLNGGITTAKNPGPGHYSIFGAKEATMPR